MKCLILVVLFVALQTAASGQDVESSAEDDIAKTDKDSPFEIVADPEGQVYFPKGKEGYFTPYYRAAGLPSLQSIKVAKGEVVFRAAVFPSFTKKLFLTYNRSKNGGTISVVRLSGTRFDKPGSVELSGKISVTEEAAERLEELAGWDVVRDPFKRLDERLLPFYQLADGIEWVLEVVDDEGYTMVNVQNPEGFEVTERQVREMFEERVRKDPSKYGLPDEYKNYEFPDLDVFVLSSFLDDLLMIADVGIPRTRGDEMPSHLGPQNRTNKQDAASDR